jgi:hypothetical protein
VAEGSIFSRPLEDWTYQDVDDFLSSRIPENETIEYKQDRTENLKDTLVAMANGEGGFIFIGVSEVAATKAPHKWPMLPAKKDHTSSPYNQAATETSPPVPLQARQFTKEDPASDDDGKSVVVVKVTPGTMPPYFAKGSGVRIRVGDGDHHADPRVLEQLFARRHGSEAARSQHRKRFEANFTPSDPPHPTILQLYMAPLVDSVRLPLREQVAKDLREIASRTAFKDWSTVPSERDSEGIRFGKPGRQDLRVDRDGSIHHRVQFDLDRRQRADAPLDFFQLALSTYLFLRMGAQMLTLVAGYAGDVYVATLLLHLDSHPIQLTTGRWQTSPEPRREVSREIQKWFFDDLSLSTGSDAFVASKQILGSLYWEANYHDYEAFLDRWEQMARKGTILL